MRILIAEDNRFFRKLLESNLQKMGHEVIGCGDGKEAWEILKDADSPKLAVLDWEMPGMQGVEICREIRKCENRPYVYIILLTAKSGKDDLIEGMDSGADDYITKPFDPFELNVRLRAAVRIVELQEKLIAALDTAEILAKEDSLTRLWNHSTIVDILKRELDRSRRQHEPVGVVMGDVDKFKQINDMNGHLAGDRALKAVAEAIKSGLRSYDSAGRYGGDEFLLILPGCDENESTQLTRRIQKIIMKKVSQTLGDDTDFTMSFGVTSAFGSEAPMVESIIMVADNALYAAKANGGNCIESMTLTQNARIVPATS